MNHDPICGDTEQLVSYVYDECSAGERVAIERHLAMCRQCATEVGHLRGVRLDLQGWVPPDVALDIRVSDLAASDEQHATSRDLSPTSREAGHRLLAVPSTRGRVGAEPSATDHMPIPEESRRAGFRIGVWAQLAAAVLLLAVAAAVAHLEVRYGSDGLVVRTGWGSPSSAAVASKVPVASGATSGSPWRADLAALEHQLRNEFHAANLAAGRVTRPAREPITDQTELLNRVRQMIEASEKRQQQELALRLTNVVGDMNAQRQSDLARIAQGFGLVEGRTGVAVAQQRELLNYLMRVSQTR